MKKQKLFALLLAFVMLLSLLSLASCGEDDRPGESSSSVAEAVKLPENGDMIP